VCCSEVRLILGLGAECSKAKALDAGEDIVGGLGPTEWFWVPVSSVDVSFDGCFEFGHGAKHAALEGSLCEQCEEALDLIDP
jgi:hypothetical protein